MSSSVLRFGAFEADLTSGELRKNGRPVKLQPQPFKLLAFLLERPGELVTRKEIRQALWGDSTFVDFEAGLNFAIMKVRETLGDSADQPHYIETLPRRGYRLIAPVELGPALPVPVRDERSQPASGWRQGQVVSISDRNAPAPHPVPIAGLNSGALAEAPPFKLDDSVAPELRRAPVTVSPPVARTHPALRWRLIAIASGVLLLVSVGIAWVLSVAGSAPRVLHSSQLTRMGHALPHGRVLTDGNRLYFSERTGGRVGIAQIPLSGGDPTPVPASSLNAELMDIDPSGTNLLFAVPSAHFEDPVWVVPAAGGSARHLGDALAIDAAWSPNGQSIAYGRENGALFIMPADGGSPHKLYQADGVLSGLRWTPDGKMISFSLRENATGATSLWEIGAGGANPHRVLQDWQATARSEDPLSGAWSPDGRYFVFRSRPEGPSSVWAVRVRRGWFRKGFGSPVRLYTSPDQIGPPTFSRDGKKLYFVNFQPRRELVRFDPKLKQFVPYLSGIPARALAFSRDGQWVAYRRDTDGTLWRSRADGTERLQLTFPPLDSYHPSWSPAGDRIAFSAGTPGNPSTLYSVPVEGGTPALMAPDDPTGAEPSWSPDSRRLLFRRWDSSSSARGSEGELYVLDWSSGAVRKLPGSESFPDGFKGTQWSPDGRYAAAVERNSRLMLFDFSAEQWSELTAGADINAAGMRWSADSRYVYYQDLLQGEEQPIFRVRLSDRKVEKIASSREILSADLLSYTMTGLTPDGSPVASLLHSASDIYALEVSLP